MFHFVSGRRFLVIANAFFVFFILFIWLNLCFAIIEIEKFKLSSSGELFDFKKTADETWNNLIFLLDTANIPRFRRQTDSYTSARNRGGNAEPEGGGNSPSYPPFYATKLMQQCNCCSNEANMFGINSKCPPGQRGNSGRRGTNGENGTPGKRGLLGVNGIEIRYIPDECIECPSGPPGDEGDQGMEGSPGPPGLDGQPGLSGQMGEPGWPGSPGDPGHKGIPGPDGPPGQDGLPAINMICEPGPPGFDGPPGPPGRTGHQGKRGKYGERGVRGPPGSDGFLGSEGQDGPPGEVGDVGPPGNDVGYCPCPSRGATPDQGYKLQRDVTRATPRWKKVYVGKKKVKKI